MLKIQNAARNSTEWFENVERYTAFEAPQFAYSLLTRSQRISHENLRLRDAGVRRAHGGWFADARRTSRRTGAADVHAVHAARRHACRIASSSRRWRSTRAATARPTTTTSCTWAAARTAAPALVFTEMTCVSRRTRASRPGCAGMYAPRARDAWRRIVDYVHARTPAKIALQLGHAGPEGLDAARLGGRRTSRSPAGNWPLIAPSAIAYGPRNQVPRAMTADRHGSRRATSSSRAAQWAAECGFDWLELHCAHGYLLSAFICPLTNRRDDAYGGSLENRCRYPLEVFRAMRAVWPADKPMSVRISAHDWAAGGNTPRRCGRRSRGYSRRRAPT